MCLRRLGQRQYGIRLRGDHSTLHAVGEEAQRVADQLGPVVEHRKIEADQRLRLRHEPPRRQRFTGPARRAEEEVPAEGRQGVEVLLEHVAADGFDQDVHAAAVGEL
jgi:hypothetical protein